MDFTLFHNWMDENQGYDIKTIKMYERSNRQFFDWISADKVTTGDLKAINAGDIRDYRKYLAETRLFQPSSINKALQAIRIFFRWALESGRVSFSPAHKVAYIEEPLLAPKSLDPIKEDRIRAAIKSKPLKTQVMIELALSAGLRVSETVALKLVDVTLSDEMSLIRVRCGKGFKYRTVPMTRELSQLLEKYMAERKNKLSPFLFTAERTGQKISTRTVQKMVEAIRKKVEFQFSYHTLRHSFCSDLLRSGTELADVALIAGHIKKNGMPNVLTTARYVLSRPEDLDNAVKQMERWRNKAIQKVTKPSFVGKRFRKVKTKFKSVGRIL